MRMSISEKRALFGETANSSIGNVIIEIIKTPFDFTKEVISTPFNFVEDTVGGIGTRVVLIAGLAIAGIYFIGKFGILKDLKVAK